MPAVGRACRLQNVVRLASSQGEGQLGATLQYYSILQRFAQIRRDTSTLKIESHLLKVLENPITIVITYEAQKGRYAFTSVTLSAKFMYVLLCGYCGQLGSAPGLG